MSLLCYRRHCFPAEIIQHAIWLYLRYPELPRRRGTAGRARSRHLLRNGSALGAEIRSRDRATAASASPSAERPMAFREGGADRRQGMYLWRAVDHEGEVLDMLVQRRRDSAADE